VIIMMRHICSLIPGTKFKRVSDETTYVVTQQRQAQTEYRAVNERGPVYAVPPYATDSHVIVFEMVKPNMWVELEKALSDIA